MSINLNAIQARVDAATEGPWHAGRGATSDGAEFVRTHEQKAAFLALSLNEGESELWLVDNGEVIPAATGDGPKAKANSEFIAQARTDVPALLAYARDLEARLGRVEKTRKELFEFSNDDSLTLGQRAAYRDASRAIDAALTVTEGA